MHYLMCRHKVADYAKWRRVFDSHAEAQRKAGLHLLHVLRDTEHPNMVTMFFRADELKRAREFTSAPSADDAARDSGVIGVPEIRFLSD